MKLKFVIDAKYDSKMIWHMLQGNDWQYRAAKMGLDSSFGERIHASKETEAAQELDKLVKDEYDKVLPFMEKTVQLYQSSWDDIIQKFSQTVEQLTYPWLYPEYICIVTNFHVGISNWNGNLVARWWKENHYLQRRITAHEILLAHYFSIHRHYLPNSGLTDRQIWALAEVAALALTGLESKLIRFWPWDKRGYSTDHNYPHLVELQEQLRAPFEDRKDFQAYLEIGTDLVKKYQF